MSLFKKAPKTGADGYQRKSVRGYADKGPVANMLAEGWEIESFTPFTVGGSTLKQGIFLLRKAA